LNSDGHPVKIEKFMFIGGYSTLYTYSFMNGNLMNVAENVGGNETYMECNYDDKKSPFYNCTTPRWYMFAFSFKEYNYFPFQYTDYFPFQEFASQNNGLRDMYTQELFTYEYDSDGFPTKRTNTTNSSVTEFKYKK